MKTWVLWIILLLGKTESLPVALPAPVGPDTTIKVFTLSDETRVPIPPPPLCVAEAHPGKASSPAHLILWRSLPSRLIGSGVIYKKKKVVGSCTVSFFGISTKVITRSVPQRVWPADIEGNPVFNLEHGETLDLTKDPVYLCEWNTEKSHLSSRLSAKAVDVYLSSNGLPFADDREWEPTDTDSHWQNGLELLVSDINLNDLCAYEPLRAYDGHLLSSANASKIFIGTTDYLRIVLEPDHSIARCKHLRLQLYPTDLGIPASVNLTIQTSQDPPHLRATLSATEALFAAEMTAELARLAEQVNYNLVSLDRYLCIQRQQEWARATAGDSPNELARFITRDPFSVGRVESGRLWIRLRELLPWEVKLRTIHLLDNGTIEFSYKEQTHFLEPVSGLVDQPTKHSTLLPPLVELTTGRLVDLRDRMSRAGEEYRWVHTDLTLRTFNFTVTHVPAGSYAESGSLFSLTRYTGMWDHFTSLLVVPGAAVLALSAMVLVCLFRTPIMTFLCKHYGPTAPRKASGRQRSRSSSWSEGRSRDSVTTEANTTRRRSLESEASPSIELSRISALRTSLVKTRHPKPAPPRSGWERQELIAARTC